MNVCIQAIVISSQFQNVANDGLQQAFPVLLANEGFYTMCMFGAINMVRFAYLRFFIAEANIGLEEMDTIESPKRNA